MVRANQSQNVGRAGQASNLTSTPANRPEIRPRQTEFPANSLLIPCLLSDRLHSCGFQQEKKLPCFLPSFFPCYYPEKGISREFSASVLAPQDQLPRSLY